MKMQGSVRKCDAGGIPALVDSFNNRPPGVAESRKAGSGVNNGKSRAVKQPRGKGHSGKHALKVKRQRGSY